MTDIIERVARAIGDAHETAGQRGHLRTMRPSQLVLTIVARAAIEAMREPTEAMVEAWNRTAVDANCPCERASVREWSNEDIQTWVTVNARADWRAMIDAALNPDPLNQLGDGATDPLHRSGP